MLEKNRIIFKTIVGPSLCTLISTLFPQEACPESGTEEILEIIFKTMIFFFRCFIIWGISQVTKDKRWEEVAIALKLEGIKMKFPSQLQNVYALFLFQFEQIYFYRAPEKKASDPGVQSFLPYIFIVFQ